MQRRTFLRGATASLAAARFASAFAQDSVPSQPGPEPTTIYNYNFKEMEAQRFDPLKSPAELLERYGLPRLPDPSSPAYEALSKIFSQPLRFAEPRIASAINTDNRTSLRFQLARGPIVNGSSESSRNWSGAYIQPHHGNVFTDVAGIWTIPEITNPIGPSGGLPPASSIWVGLDGQRHYFNSTLPQIGTRQEFDAHGAIKYWGWYQWWMRDEPSTYTPSQIPIILTGNDTVFSIVQVQSPTKVVVAMAKLNPPVEFWSVSKDAPSSARISGATAEWVVERPSPKDAPEMLNPLPGSDPIVFKSCVARAATTFNAPIGVLQNLDGARLIQMFEPRPNPARTIRLARATRVGLASPHEFRVEYAGP